MVLLVTALVFVDLLRKYIILRSQLLFMSARQKTVDFITDTVRTCVEDLINTIVVSAWNKGKLLMQNESIAHLQPVIRKLVDSSK